MEESFSHCWTKVVCKNAGNPYTAMGIVANTQKMRFQVTFSKKYT